MSGFETVEVPFITVDNRQCLAEQQLVEMPWLRDLVKTFPHCFEYDDTLCVYWYYPGGIDAR